MDAFRKFFEDHAAFFGVVVPILAIVGSFVGSWAAGWIQARGGRDQAAAAREAAKIAAEAQRVAVLWTVRQTQVAELIRTVNRLFQACRRLWNVEDEELADRVGDISEEMSLLWAEVRLVVTKDVADAAGELVRAAVAFESTTQYYAPVLHARGALRRLTLDGDERGPEISRILGWGEGDPDRSEALRNLVPGLSEEHAYNLLAYHDKSDDYIRDLRSSTKREFYAAVNALVHEARTMLRSEDDVAPTVPPQRLWRRRPVA